MYNHITISQKGNERCMLFGRYKNNRETCIDINQPDFPLFEYTEMMFIGFLFQPETKKVLLIGLGGGYIPTVFRLHLSDIKLQVVEIDPFVSRLAMEYFQFEVTENINLVIADGRQYLKKEKKIYEQIWLDAFHSDYIPAHMTTVEFLTIAKSRLTTHGIVVANVHNSNKLFDYQINTYRNVFKYVFVYEGIRSGNSIIIACDNPLYTAEEIFEQANKLNVTIGKINLLKQVGKYNPNIRIINSKLLTDDYCPANLLFHQPNEVKP